MRVLAVFVDGRCAVLLGAFENWLNIALVVCRRVANMAIAELLAMAALAMGVESTGGAAPCAPPPKAGAAGQGHEAVVFEADSDEKVFLRPKRRHRLIGVRAVGRGLCRTGVGWRWLGAVPLTHEGLRAIVGHAISEAGRRQRSQARGGRPGAHAVDYDDGFLVRELQG